MKLLTQGFYTFNDNLGGLTETMEEKENVQEENGNFSRRAFVGTVALAGTLAACAAPKEDGPAVTTRPTIEPGPDTAPDGPVLKAGLIGCGGRGTGAALNFLDSGPNLELAAMADLFEDRLEMSRERIKKEKGVEVDKSMCFTGFDAYKKMMETDVDIIIQATPPHFRPEHFAAAVEARKHVFMEKPLAVDPAGYQSIIASSEKADALGLCVVTGTQFRHWKSVIETYNQVAQGAIGDIVSARGYSLRGQLWFKEPRREWNEMEAMIRDWVNWNWLSGDHIVEQHIHGLDVMFWFIGEHPVKAVATGGRARRVTGDQYDFFAVDYETESGIHINTTCRQIDGCTNNISRWIMGTKGYTDCSHQIFDLDGNVIWKYKAPPGSDLNNGEDYSTDDKPAIVQEHTDLVTAIRTGNRVNWAPITAESTLAAIMGRESAYTGLEVTKDELLKSGMHLGPDGPTSEYKLGKVGIKAEIPVPGVQEKKSR